MTRTSTSSSPGGAFTADAAAFLNRVPNTTIDKPFGPAALRQLVESRL